jgi:hypothetical protein
VSWLPPLAGAPAGGYGIVCSDHSKSLVVFSYSVDSETLEHVLDSTIAGSYSVILFLPGTAVTPLTVVKGTRLETLLHPLLLLLLLVLLTLFLINRTCTKVDSHFCLYRVVGNTYSFYIAAVDAQGTKSSPVQAVPTVIMAIDRADPPTQVHSSHLSQ